MYVYSIKKQNANTHHMMLINLEEIHNRVQEGHDGPYIAHQTIKALNVKGRSILITINDGPGFIDKFLEKVPKIFIF
jgi:hypothetical protein